LAARDRGLQRLSETGGVCRRRWACAGDAGRVAIVVRGGRGDGLSAWGVQPRQLRMHGPCAPRCCGTLDCRGMMSSAAPVSLVVRHARAPRIDHPPIVYLERRPLWSRGPCCAVRRSWVLRRLLADTYITHQPAGQTDHLSSYPHALRCSSLISCPPHHHVDLLAPAAGTRSRQYRRPGCADSHFE
jgi:hypothetical protein